MDKYANYIAALRAATTEPVAPTPSDPVKQFIAAQTDTDPEIAEVVRANLNQLRSDFAPPSPDIAGLVERAENAVLGAYSDRGTRLIAEELLTELQRVAQERDAAVHKFEMLADTSLGIVARAVAAEARIATARDALEAISSPTQTEGLLWWQVRAREALAAIRALKGTKP